MSSKLIKADRNQHLKMPEGYQGADGQWVNVASLYRQQVGHQLEARVATQLKGWCPEFLALGETEPWPRLELPQDLQGEVIHWRWQDCQGQDIQGSIFTHQLADPRGTLDFESLGLGLKSGVWYWQTRQSKGSMTVKRLVQQAFAPQETMKYWGPALQLYSIRSQQSWGMGDFSVLKRVIQLLAPFQPGFIGLNPLHALDPFEPEGASPYSPTDRHALNPLYIDPHQLELWPEIEKWWAWHPRKQLEKERVQQLSQLDYSAVARLKYSLLLKAFQLFDALDAQHQLVTRVQAFAEQNAWLDSYSRFFAIRSRYGNDWPRWNEQVRALSLAPLADWPQWLVRRYRMAQFLQYCADQQLQSAAQYAKDHHIPLGLYLDLAVGASQSGSEVWQNRELMATGLSMGAPPDALAPQGQDWGLPVVLPSALEYSKGRYWQDLLAANMRHAGALRIDHAMAISRIWAVPQYHQSSEGAYVGFDFNSYCLLLNQVSQDSQTLVIAEDLGTVPDEVATEFPKLGYRGMSMLIYERDQGELLAPDKVKQSALAVLSSHDMPPLSSFWSGSDIELRRELELITEQQAQDMHQGRAHERQDILRALGRSDTSWTADLNLAFHAYLLDSKAELVSIQIEDMLMMDSPINVPGTSEQQYSNWRRAIPLYVEEWPSFDHFMPFFTLMHTKRPAKA